MALPKINAQVSGKSLELRYKGADNSFRIWTQATIGGKTAIVGAVVKNAGKNIDVNSIQTVFGVGGAQPKIENVVYPKTETEIRSVLIRHNSGRYTISPKSSDGSLVQSSDGSNEIIAPNSSQNSGGPRNLESLDHLDQLGEGSPRRPGTVQFSRTLPEESETPEEKAAIEEAEEENREKEGRSGRRAFVVRDGVREYQDAELVKTGGVEYARANGVTGISIPEGVVTPALRAELERLGVDISRQPRSAYSWEKIAGTKKNPQTITAPRFKAGAFSADATPKDMATAAKKSVERAGGVNTPRGLSINIPAFGDVVIAGSAGFKHGLHPRGKPYEKLIKKANADILPVVGEILKSSIPVNELRPRDSSTVGATILLGAAVNEEGAIIPVVSVVNHTRDDSQKPEVTIYPLKSVNAKDRTPAMLFYGTPDTSGLVGVNMAGLVEQIKDEVPIFSLDVYDHFKQERPMAILEASASPAPSPRSPRRRRRRLRSRRRRRRTGRRRGAAGVGRSW